MTLLEKLDMLKARTGDNTLTLAKKAGIPPTTLYGLYTKGYANMKLSTLQALCDYFGVSLDYLAKDDAEEKPVSLDGLAENSKPFSDVVQALDPERQRVLLVLAKALAQDQEAQSAPRD